MAQQHDRSTSNRHALWDWELDGATGLRPDPIRVMHVITRMIVGGAQENTLSSVVGLGQLPAFALTLVTGPETGPEGDLLAVSQNPVDVQYVRSLRRNIRLHADVHAAWTLYRLFRRSRPHVVHTHSSKAGVLGRVAAKAARVPVVVHTLHGLPFHDYQPKALNVAYRTIKRSMAPFTDHYVSVSHDVAAKAMRAGIGASTRHSVIRSGFETAQFVEALLPKGEAQARMAIPPGRTVVGVVARLFPLKGHADILEAATNVVHSHRDVLFVLVGDGVLRPELERAVVERGLAEHVQFLGLVQPEQMPTVYSSLDILIHASRREGLARVLPQAVLAGVPIVTYDLDSAAEVVVDGENGFLVPPCDTAALADRVSRLVGDAELRAQLGGKGRERIRHEFSVDEMARQLARLYTRLLSGAGLNFLPAARGTALTDKPPTAS